MEAPTEKEMEEAREYLRAKLALPKPEFEKWANELLDKAHQHHVGHGKRRR